MQQQTNLNSAVHNASHNEKLRNGYKALIKQIDPNLFITLATNRTIDPTALKSVAGGFFARMDRKLLGTTWIKQTHRRTNGIGFIEHTSSNIHAHVLAKFKVCNQYGLALHGEEHWQKLCPSGSITSKPIYDLAGIAEYCTKEMNYRQYDTQDQLFFLGDYFPK